MKRSFFLMQLMIQVHGLFNWSHWPLKSKHYLVLISRILWQNDPTHINSVINSASLVRYRGRPSATVKSTRSCLIRENKNVQNQQTEKSHPDLDLFCWICSYSSSEYLKKINQIASQHKQKMPARYIFIWNSPFSRYNRARKWMRLTYISPRIEEHPHDNQSEYCCAFLSGSVADMSMML